MVFSDTTPGYSLLDYGDGRKLEMFGGILLDRPAPQATGPLRFPRYWKEAYARYDHDTGWQRRLPFSEPWQTTLEEIVFELRLSSGGQVGVFPEQAENRRWIKDVVSSARRDIALLNAFAYTGGATLAAITAPSSHRVELCHLDGAKSAVAWARRNAALNGKDSAPVRWVVDDVLSFLKREARRGRRYDGIILDPPAFGRGLRGKRWKLSTDLSLLLEATQALLSERPLFFLLSWHDPSLSLETVFEATARLLKPVSAEKASLALPCDARAPLPAGMALRLLF